jgi:hypothetical protein
MCGRLYSRQLQPMAFGRPYAQRRLSWSFWNRPVAQTNRSPRNLLQCPTLSFSMAAIREHERNLYEEKMSLSERDREINAMIVGGVFLGALVGANVRACVCNICLCTNIAQSKVPFEALFLSACAWTILEFASPTVAQAIWAGIWVVYCTMDTLQLSRVPNSWVARNSSCHSTCRLSRWRLSGRLALA